MMRLAIHDPTLWTPAQRKAGFAAHDAVLADLARSVRSVADDAIPQHRLVVGESGSGKTMLLARLADEIDGVYCSMTAGAARTDDLWRAALDRLSIAVHPESTPLQLLVAAATERKHPLVLCVDGFDRVLEGLAEDAWQLREVLSRETSIQLIGSATTLPESTYQYDGAFFDFFATHRLERLDGDASIHLLRHIAQSAAIELPRDEARERALVQVAAGNPRALALMVEAHVVQGSDVDLMTCIDHTFDRLTPHYERLFEHISPQARVVLAALADHWHPAHAKTVAATLDQPTNRVSTYFDRLSRDGLIDKVPMPPGKTNGYQLRDRLCNTWYLLRNGPAARRRIALWARLAAGETVDAAPLLDRVDADAPTEWLAAELRGFDLR